MSHVLVTELQVRACNRWASPMLRPHWANSSHCPGKHAAIYGVRSLVELALCQPKAAPDTSAVASERELVISSPRAVSGPD